jgi:hypothetical protein
MKRFALVPLLLLSACAGPLQGPKADLAQIAAPDPVPVAVPAKASLAPALADPNRWRAWVPRQVQPNGDVVEGHWMTVSLTPPKEEVLEPARPIPRAPKVSAALGAKTTHPAPGTQHVPVLQGIPPAPQFSQGFKGIPSFQVPQAAQPALQLGGQ